MRQEIETKRASMSTLVVSIQALHVSGKQMTLAVFRQLPPARLCHDSGIRDSSLNWWGVVRYPVKDEADIWVVAERDGVLHRCALVPSHLEIVKTVNRIAQVEKYQFPYVKILTENGEICRSANDAVSALRIKLDKLKSIDRTCMEAIQLPQLFISV